MGGVCTSESVLPRPSLHLAVRWEFALEVRCACMGDTHTLVHVSVIMRVRPDDSLRCHISAVVFLETLVLELAK